MLTISVLVQIKSLMTLSLPLFRQNVVQSKTNELQELEERLAAAERRKAEVRLVDCVCSFDIFKTDNTILSPFGEQLEAKGVRI